MKKSAWYVILLLVVLVAAVAVCAGAFRTDGGEPQQTPTPTAEYTPTPTETPDVTMPEETPENTPEVTPVPTESPVFEEKEPVVPTPEPEETPVAMANGSFSSSTGTGLNMKVVWESFYDADGSIKLRVEVYAVHYSFNTSALYNAVTVSVGGQSCAISSAEVSYDGNEQTESLLGSCTLDAPIGGAEMSVVWNYKGSYSGVELETIEATGYVYVG